MKATHAWNLYRVLLQGKVRDVREVDTDHLLMMATDRISAYDVVMPTDIPDKGRVLTGLSLHWFERTSDIVRNHLVDPHPSISSPDGSRQQFAGRVMLVRRLEMFPVECVARGYLAGSAWRDYVETGSTSGHSLPSGLRRAEQLPQPIFTPATKAQEGHDENIGIEAVAKLVGTETAAELERLTLALYERAAADCERAGIILADTKFEFGRDSEGQIILADEVLTPDSSRFWPRSLWRPGSSPPSYDKQYLRDWLDKIGWNHAPPAPELPPDVVAGTRARYVEAYERITGRAFDDYLREAGA